LRDSGEGHRRSGRARLCPRGGVHRGGRGGDHEQPSGICRGGPPGAGGTAAAARPGVRQLEPPERRPVQRGTRPALRRARESVHAGMNILFLCHRLPYPPKRGGKIRPFNMIRHLSRSHRVTVATVARTRAEAAEGRALAEHCHELHVAHIGSAMGWLRFAAHTATPYPATFGYFYSAALARTVRGVLAHGEIDAIVVHCSAMGPYVAGHRGCRKIMDFGDADSEKWLEYGRSAPFPLSLGFRLEASKVRRFERRLAEQFDACSVTAPREREVLREY